jgi:hypothetical protein
MAGICPDLSFILPANLYLLRQLGEWAVLRHP